MSRPSGVRGRIALLSGQAFALGLTVAWTTVAASAIFLRDYGSGLLPVTYLGAAAAGTISTVLLGRAARKRALAHVALRVFAIVTVVLGVAWLLINRFSAAWVAFALLVVLPIAVPVGFMFIVGQAGMLLDVRTMKALYPRVIAGFALGFTFGGLIGPPVLSAVGATEHLLLAAGVGCMSLVALVWETRRRYADELSGMEPHDDQVGPVTLRVLLKNRFVVLIMAFQMLSAVESQWLDYLVYDRADRRYSDANELATFISRFLAIAYASDIVVLLLFAGVLLRRFGLRLGLTANPAVVLTLVASVVIGGVVQGAGSTLVFVLIVGARVSDLVLSDGTTRTSVSAAYQAIPKAERLAAQANVESLGVPIAIGFSGVGLMILNATIGTNGLVLPVITSIVLAAWIVVALSMYGGYRANLLLNLRRRLLDPDELSLEGPNAMVAVDRLLESGDPRDFRLGLASLTSIAPVNLADRLEGLALQERPVAFDSTLDLLIRVDRRKAEAVARLRLREPNPDLVATSLRALAEVGGPEDSAAISAALFADDHNVVAAASAAAARSEDGDVVKSMTGRIGALASSVDARERALAARMLGESRSCSKVDRDALRRLISDTEVEVRLAALDAMEWSADGELALDVVRCLGDASTAASAFAALIRGGSLCLTLADRALQGELVVQRAALFHFVRACRSINGEAAHDLLRRNARHPERDVGLAVLRALATSSVLDASRDAAIARDLLRDDVEHATRVLAARRSVADQTSAEVLRSALSDELELLKQRMLACLALIYGRAEMERVQLQLDQPSVSDRALAMEWLDVTLTNEDRLALVLIEPGITVDDQWRRLSRSHSIATMSAEDALRDLVNDQSHVWRQPWLVACALVAATGFERSIEGLRPNESQPLDHDNIVRETIFGIRRRGDGNWP